MLYVKTLRGRNLENTTSNKSNRELRYLMTDKFLIELCDGWALGYDANQWIVLRAKIRRDERYWNAVSFVRSTKVILLRIFTENGIQPTSNAKVFLDAMPERFVDWIKTVDARQKEEAA